ncbi:hypothetical protein [Xanthocytophaga agilis]|uniref:Uncharacterized protein n=1 Tax=Xanthocytophaga agilis TaxID=3048010 RepID=A0AAE3R9C2_9BACT|nr:hypothetical protein [Xanthocytophaga agilis]MDJ1503794.1 hypothetical protein [Xanthocytophaga agilis]
MKLIDVLLLYPAFALLLIGLHQILLRGFAQSYWILMLALILLYGYQWRRTKQAAQQTSKEPPQLKSKTTRKKK